MTAAAFSRRSKALTIAPVALLSAAWSVSLLTNSAAVGAARGQDPKPLPDGTSVPQQAIQAPASVPIPGQLGMGVPRGSADAVVAGVTTSGIPAPALAAYQRAAQIIDSADKGCNIPWELIAAIGRVESDHGRYGGSQLDAQGVATPAILGPVLDGKNNTQLISDTDGGLLDGDAVYDRAVGPMQFIPSTWQVVKVDADNDGKRNPQDINDAALATAVYLCSGKDDLAQRAGQEAAVYRYNHSNDYVALVLRIMEAYSAGDYTAVPSGAYAGNVFTPSYATTIQQRRHAAQQRHQRGGPRTAASPAPAGSRGGGVTTGSSDGTQSGGGGTGGGTTTQPSAPGATSGPGGGLGQVTQGLTDGVKSATSALPTPVQSAAAPVVETLNTVTKALNFCNQQFLAVNDPLHLLDPVRNACAARVQGMTQDQASQLIPDTVQGILAWLT
ncbi:MAG: lytic transglycosylase domain-containing protein [Marmoricola sp.]